MAERDFWSKFYWADWRSDSRLRLCSKAAKGVWMDFLAFAFDLDAPGRAAINGQPLELEEIGYAIDGDCTENVQLLEELAHRGVLKKSEQGVYYSKRMAAEYDLREAKAQNRNGMNNKTGTKCTTKQEQTLSNSNSNSVSTSEKNQDRRFAEFWELFPRKVARAEARRRWMRADLDGIADEVIAGLARCKASKDWKGREAKFLPYPATWLNAEGWHDEPDSGDAKAKTTAAKAAWDLLGPEVHADLLDAVKDADPGVDHRRGSTDTQRAMRKLARERGLI
jgi:hypothetical protein